jgi:PBP1b-binding outer membrane lipoprotein LpoB
MHRSHIMIILLVLLLAGCAPSSGLTSETIAIVPTFTNTVPPATSTQTVQRLPPIRQPCFQKRPTQLIG